MLPLPPIALTPHYPVRPTDGGEAGTKEKNKKGGKSMHEKKTNMEPLHQRPPRPPEELPPPKLLTPPP